MENNFNVKDLFGLEGIMKLFNTTNIKDVVALEKKLMNFLTQEQLEQIAQMEKDILNDLVNSKNSYQALQETHRKLVDKLSSIGIDANAILNPPQENQQVENELPEEIELSIYNDLGIDVDNENLNDIIDGRIREYLDDTYNASADDFDYDVDENCEFVKVYNIEWS